MLRTAETALRSLRSFKFTLHEIGRWPETTYLKPKPAAPFIHLTKALLTGFPQFPPYGGAFAEIVPYLSVADRSAAAADVAERELRARLRGRSAIESECLDVQLWESSSGRWKPMHVIKLVG